MIIGFDGGILNWGFWVKMWLILGIFVGFLAFLTENLRDFMRWGWGT